MDYIQMGEFLLIYLPRSAGVNYAYHCSHGKDLLTQLTAAMKKPSRSVLSLATLFAASLTASAATLADGLVVHLDFDNNHANQVSGSIYAATKKGPGAETYVAGKFGTGAASFASTVGGNQVPTNDWYVALPATLDNVYSSANGWALSFWVNNSYSGDRVIVSNKNFDSGNNKGWAIDTNSSGGRLNLSTGPTGSGGTGSLTNGIASDLYNTGWVNVILNVDRTVAGSETLKLYINGVEKVSRTGAITAVAGLGSGLETGIGADGAGNWGAGGALVDEFGLWDRPLSLSDISALQSQAIPEHSTSGLIGTGLVAVGALAIRRRKTK
jgi:hypothetical protein